MALPPSLAAEIAALQSDGLAVVALLSACGAAVWGAQAIYRRFFKVDGETVSRRSTSDMGFEMWQLNGMWDGGRSEWFNGRIRTK